MTKSEYLYHQKISPAIEHPKAKTAMMKVIATSPFFGFPHASALVTSCVKAFIFEYPNELLSNSIAVTSTAEIVVREKA
ncbi:MAG: hypothetical protein IJW60_01600 [Clostridia bacterium]|nr:hypothetical protein [Clostridia bacterium]